jgi:hypothetical protein
MMAAIWARRMGIEPRMARIFGHNEMTDPHERRLPRFAPNARQVPRQVNVNAERLVGVGMRSVKVTPAPLPACCLLSSSVRHAARL